MQVPMFTLSFTRLLLVPRWTKKLRKWLVDCWVDYAGVTSFGQAAASIEIRASCAAYFLLQEDGPSSDFVPAEQESKAFSRRFAKMGDATLFVTCRGFLSDRQRKMHPNCSMMYK